MDVGVVRIEAHWGCDDERLLEFLDELRQSSCDVRIERHPYGAGGPLEVYFLVSLIGMAGAFYLKAFFETLGSEHAKALNSKLLDVLQSGEARQRHRRMYPLRIGAGTVWFHISKPCTARELMERFRLAAEVVDGLADEDVMEPESGAQRDVSWHLYYWDEQTKSWQPMPFGEHGPELSESAG